eukprot:TRINITY_DN5218_c0_g1_i1.p1 TRINITY_DN5218_c0_g1~~TRINITY_DN5218_c0_g1_i1.p1  ORF type:complete len:143 (+),score=16.25 TRINITY_DN5218_c0_g1_i1:477-905(+)
MLLSVPTKSYHSKYLNAFSEPAMYGTKIFVNGNSTVKEDMSIQTLTVHQFIPQSGEFDHTISVDLELICGGDTPDVCVWLSVVDLSVDFNVEGSIAYGVLISTPCGAVESTRYSRDMSHCRGVYSGQNMRCDLYEQVTLVLM